MHDPARIAVADLGTNSTRLLVAEVTSDGHVTPVERRSEVTRLGDGVDASGRLSDAAMQRVADVLARYREIATEAGASRSVAVATSAVRDADNGQEFRDRVRAQTGFELVVIPGEEEARLTFLGATAGHSGDEPVLVIDIGGGSTEFVIGLPGRAPGFHVSTRLGSVRQSERHLASDPPEHHETEALGRAAREIVADNVPEAERSRARSAIAVAGTATSLAAIDQELVPYDPDRVDGYRLGLADCERILARLASMPLADRRRVPGLHPDRAPTIVAGAAILVSALQIFGLREAEVREADILHGVALDALYKGEHG
ncbi:MAG TPA: Ppx/GppA phosphatase family protein [Thermoleophilaceae bacterium]|nr:Ppx/GppA phosphatase family protein [Thermoleophilaceae bacterium]